MKFLKIKKHKHQVNIQVQLTDILKDPTLGNERNLENFTIGLEDGIKYYAEKFTKHYYPESSFDIGENPFSIKIDNSQALEEYTNILHYINNNSENIYKKLISSKDINESSNLNTFIEHFYSYIFNEIIDYKKTQNLEFIKVEQTQHNLKIRIDVKDLNFINAFLGSTLSNCAGGSILKNLNNYSENYQSNEKLISTIIRYDNDPHILVTSNDKQVINYLGELYKKLNKSSQYLYELSTTDLHKDFFQKEKNLAEQFSKFFDSFLAKEIMEHHLPINNNSNQRKLKL